MIKRTEDGSFEVFLDGEMIARVTYEEDARLIQQYAQANDVESLRKLLLDGWLEQDTQNITLTDGPIVESVEFTEQPPDAAIMSEANIRKITQALNAAGDLIEAFYIAEKLAELYPEWEWKLWGKELPKDNWISAADEDPFCVWEIVYRRKMEVSDDA